MDDIASARRAGVAQWDDVLDETDPHAGDDDLWDDDDLAAALAVALEPSSLLFWRGLMVGLLLSAAAWLSLAAAALVLYNVFTQ